MRVLFVCGREPEYVRNQIVLKALRQQAHVIEITDSSRNYFVRHVRLLFKFIAHFQQHDIVVVGFYGYLLVFLARLFSRRPLVFDAYLSTYQTLCFDRRRFSPHSPIGRLVFWMDKWACQLADVVIVDTQAHLNNFVQTYGLAPEKFAVLYVGCDEELFFPRKAPSSPPFRVFYYGSFLPLQGIEYIVRAAKLLEGHPEIVFQIAGQGMQYAEIRALAERLNVRNIEFMKWVPFEDLPLQIAQATICLGGHFSDIDKASNVIATKTFQFLAMRKPTIVGQNGANGEAFVHGQHVFMCAMADARALADAILVLKRNEHLRHQIAEGGYALFLERYQSGLIAENIRALVEGAILGDAVPR